MDADTYFSKTYVRFKQDGFKLQKDTIGPFDVTVAKKFVQKNTKNHFAAFENQLFMI